jgi:hypothetical protein
MNDKPGKKKKHAQNAQKRLNHAVELHEPDQVDPQAQALDLGQQRRPWLSW